MSIKLWAIIGTAEGDGLWAVKVPDGGWFPLVTLAEYLVPRLVDQAQQISAASIKAFRLVKFTEEENE